MSALTTVRRGRLAGAIVPALALGIAGIIAAQSGAQASAKTSALHASSKIDLGTTANVTKNAFTETSAGAVYYSRGAVVYLVAGGTKPKIVLHAGGTVLAIAASATGLFVQAGLTVTEYRRSNLGKVRHWTLPRQIAPVTMAGLFAEGGTLWSWIDTITDSSGFEFATISRIATTRSAVHVVTRLADPEVVAANSSGLYFESANASQTRFFLGHAVSSGAVRYRQQPVVRFGPLPLALTGGRVDLLTFGAHPSINTYDGTTLALLSSKRVSATDTSIAGASFGLAVLGQVCGQKCSQPTVSKLNPATGKTSGAVRVPGAALLIPGPFAVVIEVNHGLRGTMTMQRISS